MRYSPIEKDYRLWYSAVRCVCLPAQPPAVSATLCSATPQYRQNFESIGTVLLHDGQICSVGGAGSGSGGVLDAQVCSFISVPQILQKCAVSSTSLPQFKQILLILSPHSYLGSCVVCDATHRYYYTILIVFFAILIVKIT